MGQQSQRRRLVIDRPIQGTLMLRAVGYWVATVVAQVLLVPFIAMLLSSPDEFYPQVRQFTSYQRLTILASGLILPMILFDMVRLSHRWVGPIFRLRSALNALSRGEEVAPIRFREGDYWQELAGDFNTVAAELSRRREMASQETTV